MEDAGASPTLPMRRSSGTGQRDPAKARQSSTVRRRTLVAWASCARSSRRICGLYENSATGSGGVAASRRARRDAFMGMGEDARARLGPDLTSSSDARSRQHRMREAKDQARGYWIGRSSGAAGSRSRTSRTPRRRRRAPLHHTWRRATRLVPSAREVRVRQGWRARARDGIEELLLELRA